MEAMISSKEGSPFNQRDSAEPKPSPIERMQNVQRQGHLLVMFK